MTDEELNYLKYVMGMIYDFFDEFKKFALAYQVDEIMDLMNATFKLEGFMCGLFKIDPNLFIKYYDMYPDDKDMCINKYIEENLNG